VNISDEEIADYYTANQNEFMTPERVRVRYLELKADSLPVSTDIDDETLHALYDEQADQYITEEQRRARHILVSIPPDADEQTVAEARERALGILERLEEGEDFAEVAKVESDDPGSATSGGDLGFFGRGVMTDAFDAAAFALEKGARSDLVRSPFGFHIIEITDIRPEVVKSFAEVRDQLVEAYVAKEREDLFFEYSERLANLAFENPDTLETAADALGLEVMTSDWLSRDGGPGLGANPDIITAAFQEDVLDNGNNSEPVEIADDDLVVLRVLEHEPATVKPLAEVRDEIRRLLQNRKSSELARAEGQRLAKALKEGKAMQDVATELGVELQDSGLANRHAPGIDSELVEAAFRLPPPQGDRMPVSGLELQSGAYAILQLQTVQDGDATGLSPVARSRFTQEVLALLGAAETTALVNDLKEQATIIIPEQAE
jgi:peptidyl-prolyl cis-trans isomerase D